MQVMESCCSWCLNCFKYCYGKNNETSYLFPATTFPDQPVKTVRRISSVGQTITNEDGEEIEMPRHSSILHSYNGVPIPWSSNAITVQPGVSKMALESRLKTMPTISETPQLTKRKRPPSWKIPIPKIRKKEISLIKNKEKNNSNDIQLTYYSQNIERNDNEEIIPNEEEFLRNYQLKLRENQLSFRRGSYGSSPNLVGLEQAAEKSSSSNYTVGSLTNVSLATNLAKSTTWLNSQSLENVKDEELTAEKLARQYGLDLSLYKDNDDIKENPGHILDEIDNPTDLCPEEATGFIEFSIYENSAQNLLSIFVSKIGGLSGIGGNSIPYSVLLKVCTLSNKNSVKTSKKMPENLNPIINQSFTFFIKNKNSRILRVSVYNSLFMGRFDAIGHALISLQDFECNKNYKLKLYKRTIVCPTTGMMQISCFLSGDKFHLNVIQILNLITKFKNQKIYVKISYYCLSKKSKEKVSPIINSGEKEKLDINHQANFRIDKTGCKHDYFVVSLKRHDSHTVFKNDETIGRIFIGPCFHTTDGDLTPWGCIILKNEKLCHTYKMYL